MQPPRKIFFFISIVSTISADVNTGTVIFFLWGGQQLKQGRPLSSFCPRTREHKKSCEAILVMSEIKRRFAT